MIYSNLDPDLKVISIFEYMESTIYMIRKPVAIGELAYKIYMYIRYKNSKGDFLWRYMFRRIHSEL